jgi:heme exporter protein C
VPDPHGWLEFPFIPGLGERARNIFFHVPLAWISALGFLSALYFGIRYLRSGKVDDDLGSVSSAGLGFLFGILAALTGSVWAKFNWGSFWSWDPRETSILILLMIYGAYFTLRSAVVSYEKKAGLSAVYVIIAGAVSPFFIFVLPRLNTGLHPGEAENTAGFMPVVQLGMPVNMMLLLCLALTAFTLLFFWMLDIRIRIARIGYVSSKNKW